MFVISFSSIYLGSDFYQTEETDVVPYTKKLPINYLINRLEFHTNVV